VRRDAGREERFIIGVRVNAHKCGGGRHQKRLRKWSRSRYQCFSFWRRHLTDLCIGYGKKRLRCRTFRYRLHPTNYKSRHCFQQRYQCELYNAALEERIGAWTWERRSVSYIDQSRTLTSIKESRRRSSHRNHAVSGTLKRLDRAYIAFFQRVHRGKSLAFLDTNRYTDSTPCNGMIMAAGN